MKDETQIIPVDLDRLQSRALLVGIAGLAACAIAAVSNHQQFLRSYLAGFLFWLAIAVGCLALLMLYHLVGGSWGFVIQRILEAGSRTLPLLALLLVPILFGLRVLYIWARPEDVAADTLLQHKNIYLNIPFFLARMVLYFGLWVALAMLYNRWSRQHDGSGDGSWIDRAERLAGPGLIIYAVTISFAAVDLIMSLEPVWFSTAFGLMVICGQGVATFSFVIIALSLASGRKPLAGFVTEQHFHDLGNLLLAFVILWTYIAFAQFLIIWAGNLPDEISWYVTRLSGGWRIWALALLIFHFLVPFFLLLMRDIKKKAPRIVGVAGLLLAAHWAEMVWLVEPSFPPNRFHIHWMDVAAPIGIGGIWISLFVSQLKKRALLPLRHPKLAGVLEPAEET
jgi:hypothetical protein